MADVYDTAATTDGNLDLSLLALAEDLEEDGREDFSRNGNRTCNAEQAHQPQEQEQRYFLRSVQCSIVIRQLPSEGLSFQLWPAAAALVSLLDDHDGVLPSIPKLKTIDRNESPIRALELGAGTGVVGIAAAAIMGARVVLTDLPHVIANLRFNATANDAAVRAAGRGGSVSVDCLRWGDHEDCSKHRQGLDLILASDVVYHSHLFEPLLQTIELLMGEETVLVIAHLRRWKKDALFFKRARKFCDVDAIHRHPPFPGSRVGVTVYSFAKKRASCK